MPGCELLPLICLLAAQPSGVSPVETCAIAWQGDPDALLTLFNALEARGVDPRAGSTACAPLSAKLEPKDERLLLSLTDASGRSQARLISDVGLAAALVESWARIDLASGLLDETTPNIPAGPRLGPNLASATPAAAAPAASSEPGDAPRLPPTLLATPEPSAHALDLGIGAGPELGLSEDGALWLGAAAQARLRLGAIEPNAGVRFQYGRHQHASFASAATRMGVDLLLGADLPIAAGPIVLRPGVAIGAGWLNSQRVLEVPVANCPTCALVPLVGDQLERSVFGPRAEARFSAAWAMSPALALELSLAATLAPLAHGDPIEPAYALGLPSADRARLSISGEPLFIARAALGLRWEVL